MKRNGMILGMLSVALLLTLAGDALRLAQGTVLAQASTNYDLSIVLKAHQ